MLACALNPKVEARKLERQYPRASKVKYRGSQHPKCMFQLSAIHYKPCKGKSELGAATATPTAFATAADAATATAATAATAATQTPVKRRDFVKL